MKSLFFTALTAIGISLNTSAEGLDALPLDGYAAVVNERIVTIGDVMLSTYESQQSLRLKYTGADLKARQEELFYAGLERLIDQALILEEFEAQEGQIPDRSVDDRINTIVYENFDNDKPALLAALAKDGITLDEWRETIRESIIMAAMRQNEIGSRVVISPKQIIDAYENNKAKYEQPEEIKLRLIFIETEESKEDSFSRAQETRMRILNGELFEDVAKEVSADASAANGGDWGWLNPQEMREELRTAISELPVRKISEPVYTEQGYYLVQVEERKEASAKELKDVRPEIERELRIIESEKLYETWMNRLRKKHSVMYFIPRPPDQS